MKSADVLFGFLILSRATQCFEGLLPLVFARAVLWCFLRKELPTVPPVCHDTKTCTDWQLLH